MEKKFPVWVVNCNSINLPNTVPSVYITTNSLVDSLRRSTSEEINNCLKAINVKECNSYHIVSILRVLARNKSLYDYWNTLEKEVRLELSQRGFNTNQILSGINED